MRSFTFASVFVLMLSGTAHAGVMLPCTEVTAEESSIVRTANELAASAKITRTMTGCRVSRGDWPMLIFATGLTAKGDFAFYFSQEIEDIVSAPAIRGLVAHELGHLMAPDHDDAFWRPLTPEQRLNQEAQADTVAGALVGTDAIKQAIDEYQELFRLMVRRSQARMDEELKIRRKRLDTVGQRK